MNWQKKRSLAAAKAKRMSDGIAASQMICFACFAIVAVLSLLSGDPALALAVVPAAGVVTIADKVAGKRKDLTESIDQRDAVYDAINELEAEESTLEAIEADKLTDQQKERLAEVGKEISGKYKETRSMTADIDKQQSDLHEAQARLDERNKHEAEKARMKESAGRQVLTQSSDVNPSDDVPVQGGRGNVNVVTRDATPDELDHDISDFIRCAAVTGSQPFAMQQYASQALGNTRLAGGLQEVMTAGSNGAVLPNNMANRVIELLRPKSVVRSAGPRLMPLINGNLRLPRHLTGASASYSAESANIGVSTPTTDQVTLTAKKLTALVVQTGELIRRSDPSSDALVRDDLIRAVATKEDVTFLRSDGSSNAPKGLLKFATDGSTVINANATVNAANVEADISLLVLTVEAADVEMVNCCFFMTPRTATFLGDLRDSNGHKIYPEMNMSTPMLKGYPVYKTTNIPNNLGSGTDESEVYFGDMNEFVIADAPTFILEANAGAAYYDGSAVQASFSRDEVPIRIIVEHDAAMRHAAGIAVLDDVLWGAA